jgi:hypothetical protein
MDSALGVETRERVVGHGPEALEWARRRSAALAEVLHPGVLAPTELRREHDGSVIAIMPRIDGDDVGALLLARGGLSVGECVTLGVAVADALAAMHRAGLAHGDVSPANIMVGAASVTLVDTMGAPGTWEAGTPGYQAPERDSGASAPADVFALGKVLTEAVRAADAERIEAWVAPMLAPEPSVRPTAAMVARALLACAAPEPIERPMLGVAEAMRTRAVSDSAARTERRDYGRPWRVWRRVRRWGVVVLVAAGVAFVALFLAPRVAVWANPPEPPGFEPAIPLPAHATVTPEQAARDLTETRFAAIAAADADALRSTTAAGSMAREDVEPVAAALEAGGLRIEGLSLSVEDVRVVSAAGRRFSAVVTYAVSPHIVWNGSGQSAAAGYEQTVELDAVWSEAGWQVERARTVEPGSV